MSAENRLIAGIRSINLSKINRQYIKILRMKDIIPEFRREKQKLMCRVTGLSLIGRNYLFMSGVMFASFPDVILFRKY